MTVEATANAEINPIWGKVYNIAFPPFQSRGFWSGFNYYVTI